MYTRLAKLPIKAQHYRISRYPVRELNFRELQNGHRRIV
jgi:hypothetical protein